MSRTLVAGLLAAVLGLLCGGGEATAVESAIAVPGEPFGVGRVVISAADVGRRLDPALLQIEGGGRVFYPAVETPKVPGGLLRDLLGVPDPGPQQAIVHFLYKGTEPLDVTIYAPGPVRVKIPSRADGAAVGQSLLEGWWNAYREQIAKLRESGDFPPLPATFLEATLARRLALETTDSEANATPSNAGIVDLWGALLNVESVRDRMTRRALAGAKPAPANLPLPTAPRWTIVPRPPAADATIEPIALRAPVECLYVRFGSFENQVWFDKLQAEFGGDLFRMIAARGFSVDAQRRFQSQIAVAAEKSDEMFGSTVLRDVALVGTDPFMAHGCSMGLLFETKSSLLFGASMAAKRRAAVTKAAAQGATLETVTVAGREVSFLSTPDNRLRSYYLDDGDFHFVTNSRRLMERFIETGAGKDSLGASDEFRIARGNMPADEHDTLFAYLSSAFFRNLASPAYQIELRRRAEAIASLDALRMARWMAAAEGVKGASSDELVDSGILPEGFGRLPDGSGVIETERETLDSLRGARGFFLPIADVVVEKVTAEETKAYERTRAFLEDKWRDMDPIVARVSRYAGEGPNRERLAIDARLAMFDEEKYGWIASLFGPPAKQRIAFPDGDVIQLQAFVTGGVLDQAIAPHFLFTGVNDEVAVGGELPKTFLDWLRLVRETPGYLGSYPNAGFLDLLPLGFGPPPDERGYSRYPLGLFRRQGPGHSVFSYSPETLERVTPRLRLVDAEDEAQVRLKVGDLSTTKLRDFSNRLAFERARSVSRGNALLLDMLGQQFRVNPDTALAEAKDLFDGELVCALGGEYSVRKGDAGGQWWTSSAWSPAPDAKFTAPILTWFRGLDAGLTKLENQVIVRAVVDVERRPAPPSEPLVKLPDFGGWFGLGEKKPKDAEAPKDAKPLFPEEGVKPPRRRPR